MAKSTLPRALGWVSIGLGLSELVGTRQVLQGIGAPRGRGLVRAYGLREILAGIGLLRASNTRPWLWARVAGDALDLLTLGAGFREPNANRRRLTGAVGAVLGVTLVDLYAASTA